MHYHYIRIHHTRLLRLPKGFKSILNQRHPRVGAILQDSINFRGERNFENCKNSARTWPFNFSKFDILCRLPIYFRFWSCPLGFISELDMFFLHDFFHFNFFFILFEFLHVLNVLSMLHFLHCLFWVNFGTKLRTHVISKLYKISLRNRSKA